MIAQIAHKGKSFSIDLSQPIDISIPLSPRGPRAWYVSPMSFTPVINQHFRGSVKLGGGVNFNDVYFNPHGHGTHTESVGHISPDLISVNEVLRNYFFISSLVSIEPERVVNEETWSKPGDRIITKLQIMNALGDLRPEALVIRTMPNDAAKMQTNYSTTNFPYFEAEALAWLAEINVLHLLVDLPSVDREEDGGMLMAHRAFWRYPEATRFNCTITEFVFVPENVQDGTYFLNLQTAPFENDAAPSRPVLFRML